MDVVYIRPRLTADFQQIPETGRCQDGDFSALALDQCIRADRRSVRHPLDPLRRKLAVGQNSGQSCNNREFRRLRRGRDLVKNELAAASWIHGDVGECSAYIDADVHSGRLH